MSRRRHALCRNLAALRMAVPFDRQREHFGFHVRALHEIRQCSEGSRLGAAFGFRVEHVDLPAPGHNADPTDWGIEDSYSAARSSHCIAISCILALTAGDQSAGSLRDAALARQA